MIQRIISIMIVVVGLSACSCTFSGHGYEDYNKVESVVRNLPEAVYGEYGDSIPASVNGDTLMVLLKRNQQYHEHSILIGYDLEFQPYGDYYYLRVLDAGCLIIADYSCTPIKVDSPVYRLGLQVDTLKNPCETTVQ